MKRILSLAVLSFLALPAWAAEHAEEGAAAGGKSAVPQFDPSTWAGQLFWLVITFVLLYILMAKIALPRVGRVVEQRAERLMQDRQQAGDARDRTASLQKSYEYGLSSARMHARETLSGEGAKAQKQQADKLAAQNATLVARVKEAEAKIAAARTAAINTIKPAAEATARAVVQKLVG